MEDEELISVSEAAAIAGMTRQHVGRLIREGKLRARKVGRAWVTTRAAVKEYLRDEHMRSKDPLKDKR